MAGQSEGPASSVRQSESGHLGLADWRGRESRDWLVWRAREGQSSACGFS